MFSFLKKIIYKLHTMLVQKKSVILRPHKHILIVDLFVCFLYSFGTFDIVDGTYRIVLYMCYWKNFDNLTLVCKPKLKTLLFVLSKNLRLDKHILIKWTYSRYGIYSLPQSLGLDLLRWQVPVCVFTCVQGLLIPQGLDLGCYEQMVIITKAQKAAAEDRGVLL